MRSVPILGSPGERRNPSRELPSLESIAEPRRLEACRHGTACRGEREARFPAGRKRCRLPRDGSLRPLTIRRFFSYNPFVSKSHETYLCYESGLREDAIFYCCMRPRSFPKPSDTAKEGTVAEALPSLAFRIKMRDSEGEVLGYLAGKMKMNHIRVLPGDRVLVEMSPDGRRGRIIRRL